jgi:hypothetical protein
MDFYLVERYNVNIIRFRQGGCGLACPPWNLFRGGEAAYQLRQEAGRSAYGSLREQAREPRDRI